ncbi:MAG TPA: flavodoxin-dependent (E)-4-hydroxy-3-methylbut-2-enyl-diphosphate synthase [Spirochaetia bacterium]|nr:flavodoxin-dependent (E)-4-hydroxy-3-methylbut-2-enyl-diphosphate synthase [Spirochaetia bacterium]
MNEASLTRHYSPSRTVKVGTVVIGGDAPVTVQTMWKTPLAGTNPQEIITGIQRLQKAGCALLRFAVPSLEEARLLIELQKRSPLPLVADVHFDHRIALACITGGIPKIRINPGNIGGADKAGEVIRAAKEFGVALRIGVNAGSLPRLLRNDKNTVKAMLMAAEEERNILERYGFYDAVFSFKSSDVETTIRVNRLFRERYDYPLHLGVTEAGPLIPGIVRNTAALYTLLTEGIGETLRVSLSSDPLDEVATGREILKTSGRPVGGVTVISCPTCGRSSFPVRDFYERVKQELDSIEKEVTVAIMGCPVNGPGEARHADLGITGAGKQAVIFKKGKVLRRELIENAFEAFVKELRNL